jgi:hypothetical protein
MEQTGFNPLPVGNIAAAKPECIALATLLRRRKRRTRQGRYQRQK